MSTNVAYHHAECDRLLAKMLQAPQNPRHCCTKGCSACCSEAVYASESEVDYILDALSLAQKHELAVKLNDWIEKTKPLIHEYMPDAMAWRGLNAVCPFLKHNLCSIYSRRPYSCRVWYATGNPENCNLPARKHQKFLQTPVPLLESMASMIDKESDFVMDNMGAILAQKLLGLNLMSGSRQDRGIHLQKT